MSLQSQIPESWQRVLRDEFAKPYFAELEAYVEAQYRDNTVFPAREHIFTAFGTPYEDVKVLLLGQDPYHGPGQAHGLSFSVLPGVATPPSLRNMYKELVTDCGCSVPDNGYLMPWDEQGVMLLNAVLTVRQAEPASHKKRGWERFTDAVITALNEREEALVFLLWGGYAKKKAKRITHDRHIVHENGHPSPLSAKKYFFGTKPFSKCNEALAEMGKTAIDWQIP